MRNLLPFCFCLSLLTLSQQIASAQHVSASVNPLTPQEKVDSTFTSNFISLENRLRHHEQPSSDERAFMYVCDLTSGLSSFTVINYTIELVLNELGLKGAQKWYATTRTRIEWPKLQREIKMLNSIPKTFAEAEQREAELEALRIK